MRFAIFARCRVCLVRPSRRDAEAWRVQGAQEEIADAEAIKSAVAHP